MEFFCSQCTKRFKSIAGLRRHKQIVHGRKAVKKAGPKKISKKGFKANKKAKVKGKTMTEIRELLIENMSQLEKDFMILLDTLGLKYVSQYQIGTKFFDFYLPVYNIMIEVDGDYFHAHPDLYKKPINTTQKKCIRNDRLKNRLCEEKGIRMIRVWESEFRNTKALVLARLITELNII